MVSTRNSFWVKSDFIFRNIGILLTDSLLYFYTFCASLTQQARRSLQRRYESYDVYTQNVYLPETIAFQFIWINCNTVWLTLQSLIRGLIEIWDRMDSRQMVRTMLLFL